MRTIVIILSLCTAQLMHANDYQKAMKENIEKLFKTNNVETLNTIAASFKRIAAVETSEWLPGYYAAYSYARSTHFISESDSIHVQLDKAQAELNGLLESNPDESELYVLQAFIYSLRITNPMSGYKYSNLSNEALSKAEQLDSNNPRVYYCRGNNIYHTPKMFGGGQQKALPLFEKAAELFTNNKNDNPLWPSWGSYHNNQMLAKCKETK
ncbi:hypothetical protein J1N10_12355 [Carboxylicivirga sp. A043]|uniref:hypothetical protein n=1 Tax=Carboxylicivirga litoralis TaxID=2816963 RepID=UPI0021CB648C|nr:hypothetical protein [Carboxylicivirga sp. A043]MCU4156773.1 hypothetical protein [Carboxylicivirga sp. A043]